MLATTIDTSIPSNWHSAITQTTRHDEAQQAPPQLPAKRSFAVLYVSGNALTTVAQHNSIKSLGWSEADALETLLRLRTFAEDWDHPGMEAYDDL